VVTRAEIEILEVVKALKVEAEIAKFSDLLEQNRLTDVLKFLETENLYGNAKGFAFQDIFYLLKDKEFFLSVIEILRKRQYFVQEVWQYGCEHLELQVIKEYLEMTNKTQDFAKKLGTTFFKHDIMEITADTTTEGFTHLLEYYPIT
jgi:hypothetical protein